MDCLVIKNDGIGDLVLCSGLLRQISDHFNGKLDLVTCETNREVAEMVSGIRKIYYVSRDNLRFPDKGIHKPPIEDNDKETLIKIAVKNYDVSICLRRFIRQSSLIVMNCVSAKEKFCCWQIPTNATWEDAKKYSTSWRHYNGEKKVLSELEYLNAFCSSILNVDFYDAPALAIENLSEKIDCDDKVVALGVSGSWPQLGAMWAQLAKFLIGDGWTVHILGGVQQVAVAEFIVKLAPAAINHIGKLNMPQTAAFLKRFKYYIGNDTGLSHLASLIVPHLLIVLGGGTFPRFFPWPNRPGQHVLFYGLDCYDCDWQCMYQTPYCIELISAKDVLNNFYKIINEEKVSRMINIGGSIDEYELLWRRSPGEGVKISFTELQKNFRV